MLYYVHRYQDGSIKGLTARPQQGRANDEQKTLSDPEIVAWQAALVGTREDRAERALTSDPAMRALVSLLAEKFAMTDREILDAIRTKVPALPSQAGER